MAKLSQLQKYIKTPFIKGVERLVKLGVLEWLPALEWASPLFIIPKKKGPYAILSIFERLIRG
jgi:hypothetical protein